jgi:hypothetical protein
VTTAHEPPRGPGTHLSTEDLSALAEGSQPGAEGAAEHLLACAGCRAEVDAISELLTAFADFEAPALPREVAIRIDAALAREVASRGGAPLSSGSEAVNLAGGRSRPGTEGPPSSPVRKRRAFPRGLGWGLASLALAAGGLAFVVNLSSPSSSNAGTATSGSAGRAPAFAAPNSTTRPMIQPQYGASSPLAATTALATWVKEILAVRAGTPTASPDVTKEAAQICASDPRFAGQQSLATSTGTYEGSAAVLVVYAPGGPDAAAVYAVAYSEPCTTGYRVLAEGTVRR